MKTAYLTALCMTTAGLTTLGATGCYNESLPALEELASGDGINLTTDTEGDESEGSGDASGDGGDESGEEPSDDGSTSGNSATPTCGGETIEINRATPNVMLVLDKSGSMSQNEWDHDLDPQTPQITRWASLHGVVHELTTEYNDALNLGAVLFPSADADHSGGGAALACRVSDDVDVPLAPGNADTVLAGIPDAFDEVRGGTPAREGMLNAINHLAELEDDAPRAVILVTDGQANCVEGADPWYGEYDSELPVAVASGFQDNQITTYVVGIDITDEVNPQTDQNNLQAINELAIAGGAARSGASAFYNATDELELAAALQAIAEKVTCTLGIQETSHRTGPMDLSVAGQAYDQLESCEDGDGWRFTTDAGDTIELCGAACEQFQETGKLETTYSCLPVG